MRSINHIRNCFGCGVCTIACARKLIKIRLNEDGFYEPYIVDINKCNNCGLCLQVCSYSADDIALKNNITPKTFAAWSNNQLTRYKCSSGGVGFEIGRYLISQDYKVCAVRFNVNKNRAEHYIASTIEDFMPSMGSKYIQSYPFDGLNQIERNMKYLITGTPCQIDSFRRYVKKFRCEDRFVLMDFFCHGVPSKLLWNKYIAELENKLGKIKKVSWRDKANGWHDSWAMTIETEQNENYITDGDDNNYPMKSCFISRLSQGDIFYKMFLSNSCLNKSCYQKCRFKFVSSSADIRIGDLWGKTYSKNRDGVSGVVAFTQLGVDILKSIDCKFIEQPLDVVAAGQMKKRIGCPITRKYVMNSLKENKLTLREIYNRYQKPYKFLIFPIRVFNKIKRML